MELNKYLLKYSIFRLLIPFIIGIIFEIYFQLFAFIFLYTSVAAIFLLMLINSTKKISHYFNFHLFYGCTAFCIMILIGVTLTSLNKSIPDYNKVSNSTTYIGAIEEEPEEKENSIKVIIKIRHPLNNKVLLYLEPSSNKIKIGDYLIFNTHLEEISNTGNPHEFNYKKYLSFHNIYYQAYVKNSNWKISHFSNHFQLRVFANTIRNKILNIYEANGLSGKELNIISAITLGYKSKLSSEIKEIFSKSGAIHVLAVSGLHVGIIYLLLSFCLKFFDTFKKGLFFKSLIIILGIWMYAIITGLSPSIQRSSLMFTIIAIGKLLNRQNSIYQSIALSAFIILLINPLTITEIGFQLSYLAVFGIIYFQPKINKLILIKNPVFSYLWALISVSLAAQITTFPLTLYYFHQFPLLFLFTNLLIIPFTFIIIFLSIAGIILSVIPFISYFIFQSIYFLTKAIYLILNFIQNQPYSVIENIFFIEPHLILTFILILFVSTFFIRKVGKYLILSLTVLFIILLYNQFINYQFIQQKKYMVYNSRGNSIHAFYQNKKCYLFTNLLNPKSNIDYSIKNDLIYSGVKKKNIKCISADSISIKDNNIYLKKIFNGHASVIQFNSIKLLIVKDSIPNNIITNNRLHLDYIVLSNNVKIKITDILKLFSAKKIIIDSSTNYKDANKWITDCRKLGIPFHYTYTEGAFKQSL